MKKQTIVGLVVGICAGAVSAVAAGFATNKVVKEIKEDLADCCFTSPEGNNQVTLTYGSSAFAKGFTFIKVQATVENGDDDCKLVVFTKNSDDLFECSWIDNDHFKLMIGDEKSKQCCDVNFEGEHINARYYVQKFSNKVSAEESDVESNNETN